jgi:transposase
VFKITPRTYYQWVELQEKTGSLQFRNANKRQRKIDPEKLKQAVEEKPDAYLRELATKFNISEAAIHKQLKKLKITYKKRPLNWLTKKVLKQLDRMDNTVKLRLI